MNLDLLATLLNDPATEAIVRANAARLPGGAVLDAEAVVRQGGQLLVVSRIGGHGPAGGSSSRFALLDAGGRVLHAPLWGLLEVAGMLAVGGWHDAVFEPVANDRPEVARRLRAALRQAAPEPAAPAAPGC